MILARAGERVPTVEEQLREATVRHVIDASNWQGDLGPGVYAFWKGEGYSAVILGTSGNPSAPLVYEAQARKALAAGLDVEAYIWLTWGTDVDAFAERVRRKLDLVATVPDVRRVWLDCEDTNIEAGSDVVGLIALARDIVRERGFEVGIYTSAWWWGPNTGNEAGFGDLPLWLAHYDGVAELTSSLLPIGGWSELYRKQYSETGSAGGVYPLDLNVERDAAIAPPPAEPGLALTYEDGLNEGRRITLNVLQAALDALR